MQLPSFWIQQQKIDLYSIQTLYASDYDVIARRSIFDKTSRDVMQQLIKSRR